jgi:GT2 family glycosyltransferase
MIQNNEVSPASKNESKVRKTKLSAQKVTSKSSSTTIYIASTNLCSVPLIDNDWVIQLEMVSRNSVSGWICVHGSLPNIQVVTSVAYEIEIIENRSDVLASFDGSFQKAFSFKISFPTQLSIDDIEELQLKIDGAGASNSAFPIFFIYEPTNNEAHTSFCFSDLSFALRKMGLFDDVYYAKLANLDPTLDYDSCLKHYLEFGMKDGNNPHPLFDIEFYKKKNVDVVAAKLDPLVHYIYFGYREDRMTTPDIDWQHYRNRYEKTIPNGISTLHHYISVGKQRFLSPLTWIDEIAIADLSTISQEGYPVQLFKQGLYRIVAPNVYFRKIDNVLPVSNSLIDCKMPVDIIISFYKEAYLIHMQRMVFKKNFSQFDGLDVRITLIFDSPDDQNARAEFDYLCKELSELYSIQIVINENNLGFVGAVNRGLGIARTANRAALLLNSDAFLVPGCLHELISVAQSDPMIAFVSPRSNNATICTYPGLNGDWGIALKDFESLAAKMRRVTYSPTAVGFCMLIKPMILKEFGFFDSVYGYGYNEENDLIMRANRFGYRAVLANHAYAMHIGAQSFNGTLHNDYANDVLINNRYPEFLPAVKRYLNGEDRYVERAIAQGHHCGGRYRLLIDASNIGPYTNGTSYLVTQFIAGLVQLGSTFDITLLASEAAIEHHAIAQFKTISTIYEWPEPSDEIAGYAAVLRMGQPFEMKPIVSALRIANTYICFMLDPIAFDCQYLWNSEKQDAWDALYDSADGIIYQSNLTQTLFRSRFEEYRSVPSLVSYHSLNPNEYVLPLSKTKSRLISHLECSPFIFIVGNHFAHKDVYRAYNTIAVMNRSIDIVVLGEAGMLPCNTHLATHFLQAGEVADEDIAFLYNFAKIIVFPSHYEGFGFPFLHAAQTRRPIVCRDTLIAREISEKVDVPLTFFSSIDDLPAAVQHAMGLSSPVPSMTGTSNAHSWSDSAREVIDFIANRISLQSNKGLHRHFSLLRNFEKTLGS